jgi:hypothetical protein
MPGWIGGYYYKGVIALNPWLLLYGKEQDIAHVLFHEGLHAGVFTNGIEVDDESFVETMTKKRMEEIYGTTGMKTGYDNLVDDFQEHFGNMSFNDLSTLVENGDEQTFDNLLEILVVNESLETGDINELGWESIEKKLKKAWGILQELFPRMINSVAGRNVGPHAGTNVELHHIKLDGLLENAAEKILQNNKPLLRKLVEMVIPDEVTDINKEDIIANIFDTGLGYIYDADPDYMNNLIEEILEIKTSLSFVNNVATGELVLMNT